MSWHYRIFKCIPKKIKGAKVQPEPYYCIKEYYRTPFGTGWSKNPDYPQGETKKDLLEDLAMMLVDAKKYRVKVEHLD